MAGAVPEVRAAQRRIVSTVNASGVICGDGLALWREVNCGESKATAAEIAKDLTMLDVPHQVVTAFRFPLANSWDKRPRRGEEVRVAKNDLKHLVRWMPSLETYIDQITGDCPGFGFTIFEPRAEGMAVMQLALAADWPRWTNKQAGAMGLMCAQCGYDLRERHNEDRMPYNIPLAKQPKKRRLVCGQCCNDGVDKVKRLAACTGQSAAE
ncbi:hypothetical protein [Streptomyces canus]|uniref:hypothetical protein n=1 Tax=Streptomyces canus TaxID=58343 RepID=UPI0027818983|nr:hypothetical protein [Streptomyces canus]MDQ0757446.1 hypothetical protein [Streptomyces canus]